MTLHIRTLLFDEWNEEHIARHGVVPEEVEQVCDNRPFVSKTRQLRLRVIGQTDSGRYLTVILAARSQGVYYPITAREATVGERQLLQRKR
jgi:uncharacterized protein